MPGLPVPMTRAPRTTASWTAAVPTLPDAPLMSTVLPAVTPGGPLGPLLGRCLDIDARQRPTSNALVAALRSIRVTDDEPAPVERDTVVTRVRAR